MDMDCLYAEYCNGKVKLDLVLLADAVIAHWIYVLEGKNGVLVTCLRKGPNLLTV